MKSELVFLVCLVATAVAFTTPYDSFTTADFTGSSSGCGITDFYGSAGVISSPNYPGNYSDYLNCLYYINANSGSSLSLFFKSFDTETCCDHVTISCPNNASYPPKIYSGNSIPNPISIPWCSRGLVRFQTDHSVVDNGFSLDYYVSNGGCGETVYTAPSGYVHSPNYPDPYGDKLNCTNIIWAPQQSTFYLYFAHFVISDCSHDWLELSCHDNAAYPPSRYCGNYGGLSLYFYGCSEVRLWFHSDTTNNYYPGFNIYYDLYGGTGSPGYEETSHPAEPITTTGDQLCGDSYFSDAHGVIRSPNYPSNYYNNLYCDYYVYASAGSTLSFIFKSLHVENGDLVTISCPPNSNFPPQEYSGHVSPEPVSIPLCSQGRVNFRTDYTSVSSGFNLEYYVSDAGCGSTVYLGPSGQVNSPFWPDGYGYNQNCTNIIWAPQQSTIRLQFHSFDLQDNCSCDWLEMSCLDNTQYGPTRYCGNNKFNDVNIYGCSQLLFWFHSDDSSNYPGFNIEYTFYDNGVCGATSYYEPFGVISSPNYPNNYDNFVYCDYTINAPTGSSTTYIFSSLNVEENYDFVAISCASNSSYPKYQFSGNNLPSPLFTSGCSQGLVNLHTDATNVASGFSLDYYVSTRDCGNTLYYPTVGNVTSPNWPNNYGFNQDCSNVIDSWDKHTFYFKVHAFILQSCCDCDWLEISCRDNSDYGPTRYCGTNAPVDMYIYNCSQVLLWFHSDGSGNDQGFNIEYTVNTNPGESKVPLNGKPNPLGNEPSNRKPNAEEKAPRKKEPIVKENIPINGKPNAEEKPPRG